MQIAERDGGNAHCVTKGIAREVSLFMLQDESIEIGDFVMVHVGYAIQKMSALEARSAWEVYDEILALEAKGA